MTCFELYTLIRNNSIDISHASSNPRLNLQPVLAHAQLRYGYTIWCFVTKVSLWLRERSFPTAKNWPQSPLLISPDISGKIVVGS
jgi:hypothetical protein